VSLDESDAVGAVPISDRFSFGCLFKQAHWTVDFGFLLLLNLL